MQRNDPLSQRSNPPIKFPADHPMTPRMLRAAIITMTGASPNKTEYDKDGLYALLAWPSPVSILMQVWLKSSMQGESWVMMFDDNPLRPLIKGLAESKEPAA